MPESPTSSKLEETISDLPLRSIPVVRIEPRKPRIEVKQKEWDGFLRICFKDVEDGDTDEAQSEFKEKVLGVLKEGDFEEKRSSKLTLQEFLYLLSLFNKAGIHFS
ncbi:unnamed protein product [Trifolium pratense]|uniref:Uncharacterized protein n=1 Tax=Trifolium pratense TaxID=57577 RepID=A0ACB0JA20_TRIPR|nr:unnamed protein product [Trifolium pratense]